MNTKLIYANAVTAGMTVLDGNSVPHEVLSVQDAAGMRSIVLKDSPPISITTDRMDRCPILQVVG